MSLLRLNCNEVTKTMRKKSEELRNDFWKSDNEWRIILD